MKNFDSIEFPHYSSLKQDMQSGLCEGYTIIAYDEWGLGAPINHRTFVVVNLKSMNEMLRRALKNLENSFTQVKFGKCLKPTIPIETLREKGLFGRQCAEFSMGGLGITFSTEKYYITEIRMVF